MASDHPGPPKKTPPLGVPVWAWLLVITSCGVAANVFHDALLEPVAMFGYLAIGIALIVLFRLRGIADHRWLVRAGWYALVLGCVLFLCRMFAWFVVEIASRGRSGEAVLWPARMGLAYFYGAVLLLLLMRCKSLIVTVIQYLILILIGLPLIA